MSFTSKEADAWDKNVDTADLLLIPVLEQSPVAGRWAARGAVAWLAEHKEC